MSPALQALLVTLGISISNFDKLKGEDVDTDDLLRLLLLTPGGAAPAGSSLEATQADFKAANHADLAAILAAIGGQPSRFVNVGADATLNVKAAAGVVVSASCINSNGASRYLQLHNTSTIPAADAVPIYTFLVPAGSQALIGTDFFTSAGVAFSTGIAFAFSTTANTYTAGTAGEQMTVIHFR